MSPAWIGPAIGILGAACMAMAFIVGSPRAKAAGQPPSGRAWAIERCHGERCELLAWRYSGPTACNVDAYSERVGRRQPTGARLTCIRLEARR